MIGERYVTPGLPVSRYAALAVETRTIVQAEDNLVVETRTLAKLPEIVLANAPDHSARADRAPSDAHESEKSDEMSSYDLT